VRPSVRDSRGSFMFPRYLQYLLTDFRQIFVTGASRDTDDLITFLGQKVKVQGHTIAVEAHSTRRYRRVQLFLVSNVADTQDSSFCMATQSLYGYSQGFSRKETSNDSGVARHAHVLWSHADVYSLCT